MVQGESIRRLASAALLLAVGSWGFNSTNWVYLPASTNGTVFRVFPSYRSWFDAATACQTTYSGRIGVIRDAASSAAVTAQTSALSCTRAWIGYSQNSGAGAASANEPEGEWCWSDGDCRTTGYTNWRSGEPSGGGFSHCANFRVSTGGLWQDNSCYNTYCYMCERDSCPTGTYANPVTGICDSNCPSGYEANSNRFCVLITTAAPTLAPTSSPTANPTSAPTITPTNAPTTAPTIAPTLPPSQTPAPTSPPSPAPTGAPTPAPTPVPEIVAETEWIYVSENSDKSFQVFKEEVSWSEAEENCSSTYLGRLAIVRSSVVNDAIYQRAVTLGCSFVWLGYSQNEGDGPQLEADEPASLFCWSDECSSSTFSNWMSNQPDDGNSSEPFLENCAALSAEASGTWDDRDCLQALCYTCERDNCPLGTFADPVTGKCVSQCADGYVSDGSLCVSSVASGPGDTPKKNPLPIGAIVGGIIGGLLVFVIFAFFYSRRKRRHVKRVSTSPHIQVTASPVAAEVEGIPQGLVSYHRKAAPSIEMGQTAYLSAAGAILSDKEAELASKLQKAAVEDEEYPEDDVPRDLERVSYQRKAAPSIEMGKTAYLSHAGAILSDKEAELAAKLQKEAILPSSVPLSAKELELLQHIEQEVVVPPAYPMISVGEVTPPGSYGYPYRPSVLDDEEEVPPSYYKKSVS